MNDYGRFGALLGTIFIGSNHCKFLIYAAKNAEILTCHEVQIKEISNNPGWIEFDPVEIWKCIVECINVGTKNLLLLDINPADIKALGITNQRETTVLWHKTNGMPVYNAIAWNDIRTSSTVRKILAKVRNKKNFLKSVCGLPLSNCFSAVKVKWIVENVNGVQEIIDNKKCLFGTLDTWVLWNLTGGIEGGIHVTDVTNASRTMLMNMETLQWDQKLCAFFQISPTILPKIKSCSEVYGYVHDGPLQGIPIAGCLGEQPASLLGQMCTQTCQATCTYDESCNLLVNTGQEIVDSENGMLSTLAFQLGPKSKPYYALEGAVANAGAAITWLKDNLLMNTDVCSKNNLNSSAVQQFYGDSAVLSSYNSNSSIFEPNPSCKTDVVFVPAFSGLYSPFWKHDSRGMILGLNHHTTAREITLAAYEAICFQTRDLLESLKKDLKTWPPLEKLTVGGDFSESPFLLQLLADICGITIERPQTSSPSCLGAMLAAGAALNILDIHSCISLFTPPADVFQPTMCSNVRDSKYRKWKYAIKKCLSIDHWDKNDDILDVEYEDKDPSLGITNSIPGGIYLISSIALLLITRYFQNK